MIVTVVVAVLIVVTSVVMVAVANTVLSTMADLRVERNQATLEDFGLVGEAIQAQSQDGLMINAYIAPCEDARGLVIILHGMHGMDATSLFGYARFIHDLGFTPVVVDMRAHGKSEGQRIGFGYTEVWDVLAVIDFLKQDRLYRQLPIIVYGLSMGGSTAINVAAHSPDVDAVIAISPYRSIQAQIADYMRRDGAPGFLISLFEPFVHAALWLRYRMNPIDESPELNVRKLRDIPVLIAHGDLDTQTHVDHGIRLYEQCSSSQKTLWIAEGKDHLIAEGILTENSRFYRDRITEFLDRFF